MVTNIQPLHYLITLAAMQHSGICRHWHDAPNSKAAQRNDLNYVGL